MEIQRVSAVKDFHELKVWQKAHELTLAIYRATVDFPRAELYGLTSQLRRASASVAAHLAEGCGRSGDASYELGYHSEVRNLGVTLVLPFRVLSQSCAGSPVGI